MTAVASYDMGLSLNIPSRHARKPLLPCKQCVPCSAKRAPPPAFGRTHKLIEREHTDNQQHSARERPLLPMVAAATAHGCDGGLSRADEDLLHEIMEEVLVSSDDNFHIPSPRVPASPRRVLPLRRRVAAADESDDGEDVSWREEDARARLAQLQRLVQQEEASLYQLIGEGWEEERSMLAGYTPTAHDTAAVHDVQPMPLTPNMGDESNLPFAVIPSDVLEELEAEAEGDGAGDGGSVSPLLSPSLEEGVEHEAAAVISPPEQSADDMATRDDEQRNQDGKMIDALPEALLPQREVEKDSVDAACPDEAATASLDLGEGTELSELDRDGDGLVDDDELVHYVSQLPSVPMGAGKVRLEGLLLHAPGGGGASTHASTGINGEFARGSQTCNGRAVYHKVDKPDDACLWWANVKGRMRCLECLTMLMNC